MTRRLRRAETILDAAEPFTVEGLSAPGRDPAALARVARERFGLEPHQPVQDICRLLEQRGVKILLLDTRRDSFFGLSVGPQDGGPAVVVNTWDRIPSSVGSSLPYTSRPAQFQHRLMRPD